MAMTVTVDATKALARFSPAGIPAQVRNNLRMAIPPLMRALGAQVDSNLAALKSRTRLKTTEVMMENATEIIGKCFCCLDW